MTLPSRPWARLNRFRTGVGRFRSCLYKRGMASSAACECGAEDQTVDHVVLQCPIHRPPHGLDGLTVLDDETTEWLLNTCPEIWRGQAVDKRTRSNERRRRHINILKFVAGHGTVIQPYSINIVFGCKQA